MRFLTIFQDRKIKFVILSISAEVLLAFKNAAGDPPSLKSWMGREPCLQSWIGVQCSGKFHNSTVIDV